MTKYFKEQFAIYGDKTDVPNDIQPSGSVSYQAGFSIDYQRKLGVDPLAKPFPRQGFNGLISDITGAVQQYQQYGFFDFITPEMNDGKSFDYSMGATVRYDMSDAQDGSDVRNFTSLINKNTGNPKDNPRDWIATTLLLMTEDELKEGASEEARAVSPSLLRTFFQEKQEQYTVIYPNGGSAEKPSNISSNNRYILENPFKGSNVICLAEIEINGSWGNPGFIFAFETSSPGGRGIAANQLDNTIVVQAGPLGVCAHSSSSGNPFNVSKIYTTAPCRVKVWRVNE